MLAINPLREICGDSRAIYLNWEFHRRASYYGGLDDSILSVGQNWTILSRISIWSKQLGEGRGWWDEGIRPVNNNWKAISEDAAEFQSISAVKRVKIAVGSTASAHKNSENSYLEALSLHCSSIILDHSYRNISMFSLIVICISCRC